MHPIWIETKETRKCGIAMHNFNGKGVQCLKLWVGDSVNTISESDDWFYGYCIKDPTKRGIFPKSFIFLKDSVIEVQGCYYPKDLPIVKEITSVLREWGDLWKSLYLNSLGSDRKDAILLQKAMLELIDFRRLIMSRKLTVDEMREVQQKVSQKIDTGNARLGLDLVIRDDHSNVIDPLNTSTIGLFKLHQQATKRINEDKEMSADKSTPKKAYSFNLYVNVKNFVCRIGENANILLTLYDAKEGTFISENYIMKWGDQGMPKDLEMLNNLRVIFMDLSEKDVMREKIFLVCQIIRIGRMDLKECESKRLARGMKRPFGVASIEVSDILRGRMDNDDEKQYFIPFLQCGDHDFMDVVIKKSITAKDINHKGQGLWVTMRNLLGDFASLQKDYPHLVTNATSIARKMGFPEVIMPGDVRNDLYVTLKQGEFKKGGHKMADKNIEVTLMICNEHGEVVNNVISEGAGGDMVSSYKSIIYYHEDKPKWFETVKISLPINESSGVHLKFTMKHRSTIEAKDKAEKPFGMSYIRLMNDDGTTINDTAHDLLVYKLDTKKLDEASNAYLKLPSTQRELQMMSMSGLPLKSNHISTGSMSLSTSDNFQISTLICSTKLTHNVDLMGLLKWRESPEDLEHLLWAFMSVDGEEIVKFLQDTLDALFNIWIENYNSTLYDKLVFDALVFIIGIVSDSKYIQFKPVLDVYLNDSFSATLAYTKLMAVLKSYIDDESMMETVDPVIKAMKSLDYIFKFIVRSRLLYATLNDNDGKSQFESLFCQVFESINGLMRDGRNVKLVVCDCIINALPSIIPHVLHVFGPVEFSRILVECMNSLPADKLIIRRMHCINSLVQTQLFLIPDCRRILLPVMLDHVCSLMSANVEVMHEHNYRDSDPDTTRFNELDVCVKILSDVMDYEFKNAASTSNNEDMVIISMKVLRLVTKTVIYLDKESSLIENCVAVLTSILRQMSESQYNQYIGQFETPFDLLDYLMEILMIFEELITKNIYPPDWNEMILLQNWVFLKTLKYFSNTIQVQFTRSFCCDLWKRFFLSTIAFIVQKPLQLENFSPAKRNKITSCYQDMRIEAGIEIRSMWNNLGQHKLEFIPDIVGPFLKMTLIPEKDLRKKTIPIFFDMMQAEFMGPIAGSKRNFSKFEHELIARVDEFVKEDQGDESYAEMFYEILKEKCESHKFMKDQGLVFVDTIRDLFGLLLQHRVVFMEDNHDNKMSSIVSLLNFYHDINREELYIRCINELYYLHLECENYTEAGYTLLTYAKKLRWSDEHLHSMLICSSYPDLDTHRKLKERLYYEIISCFDRGKVWEMGIELCKELAHQCEVETFDYNLLSRILTKQAELYDSIMKKVRPEPEYFRVGYFGLGFPIFLQNRTFVYRGKEYERLSDFVTRLQNQFPSAQALKTLNPPGDDIKLQPVQYLQMNKVTPMMELKEHLVGKKLSDQILKYFKVNEVQKFTCSRKKDQSINEVSSMWLERTILVTSYSLPGILHWFPVTSTHTVDVSPLELATETIEERNATLRSLVDQQLSDPSSRVDQLSMVINGIVDPAVNGGLANYKIFYTDEYQKDHALPAEQNLITRLKQHTKSQLIILRLALDLHRKRAPESLQEFHSLMEQNYIKMKKTLEKDYGIKLKEEEDVSYEDSDFISSSHVKRASSHEDTFDKHLQMSSSRLNIPLRVHGTSPRSEQSLLVEPRLRGKLAGSRTSFGSASTADLSQSRQSASPRISNSSLVVKGSESQNLLLDTSPTMRSSKGDIESLRQQQRQTTITTITSSPSDEPPPLPKKTLHADYANVEVDARNPHSGAVSSRRDTHRDRPKIPLPAVSKQEQEGQLQK